MLQPLMRYLLLGAMQAAVSSAGPDSAATIAAHLSATYAGAKSTAYRSR